MPSGYNPSEYKPPKKRLWMLIAQGLYSRFYGMILQIVSCRYGHVKIKLDERIKCKLGFFKEFHQLKFIVIGDSDIIANFLILQDL